MIIIVEGIDRVGKTTLCDKLHNELNIPVYKHIGPFKYKNMDNDSETDQLLQLLQMCKLQKSFIIFDRFHLTDYVYGIIERNYDIEKANNNFKLLDDFIKDNFKDAVLLLVLPTDINKSSEEHGKDLSVHNEELYKLFKESKIENKWRCTYNTLDEAVSFVRTRIKVV